MHITVLATIYAVHTRHDAMNHDARLSLLVENYLMSPVI
jgi:hypothetical protein